MCDLILLRNHRSGDVADLMDVYQYIPRDVYEWCNVVPAGISEFIGTTTSNPRVSHQTYYVDFYGRGSSHKKLPGLNNNVKIHLPHNPCSVIL
jgi:hypothetical protein